MKYKKESDINTFTFDYAPCIQTISWDLRIFIERLSIAQGLFTFNFGHKKPSEISNSCINANV